jgi:hypothetical protein
MNNLLVVQVDQHDIIIVTPLCCASAKRSKEGGKERKSMVTLLLSVLTNIIIACFNYSFTTAIYEQRIY